LRLASADTFDGDPQRLQRVSLTGAVSILRPTDDRYVVAAEAYVARFPDALVRFELGDFILFRFTPEDARYVGGFARVARFSWQEILASGLL